MEREVKVYGPLAKFVGQRKFMAEVSSAAEAVRMLLANFPGLERHMADQHYKVIVDGYESGPDQVHHPASQTIKIVPVLGGAGGNPVTNIIAGVALVALAIINPFAGAMIGTFGGAPIAVSVAVGTIGATLALGGVSQLLSPTPQLGQIGPASFSPGGSRTTTTEGSEMDPQESYSFSGIQNTSRVASPVPLIYGETIVGSVVISAGIDVDTI
jgi:predicted phage tail protein